MYFTTALFCKLKYSDEIKIYNNESILNSREDNTFSKQKQWCIKIIIYTYFCLFSASKVIMPYGKLITRFTTGGHDIFTTCPAKSMHLEPFGLSVHAFCGTGDENIITTCRSAGNYCIPSSSTTTPLPLYPYPFLPLLKLGPTLRFINTLNNPSGIRIRIVYW